MANPINSIIEKITNFLSFEWLSRLFSSNSGDSGSKKLDIKPPIAITAPVKFPSFIVVPIEQNLFQNHYAGADEEVEEVATQIAAKIKDAFIKSKMNVNNYEIIEIYAMQTISSRLIGFFSNPAALMAFENVCKNYIWANAQGVDDDRKVVFYRKSFKFDPVFEKRMGFSLLIRPLNLAGSAVPSNPDLFIGDSFQFLVGEIELQDSKGTMLAKTPLRVWRAQSDEFSYSLHLDFDVLSRAFGGIHHKVPLGIVLNCLTVIEEGERRIENVALEINEAKQWEKFSNTFVQYFLHTGYGRKTSENNISILKEDFIPISESEAKFHKQLDNVIKITRELVFTARTQNKNNKYILRLFNRASKFDPKNNYFSLTGQILRQGTRESVYTPPTFAFESEEVFQISSASLPSGRFKVFSGDKPLSHKMTDGTVTDIQPNNEFVANFGDEITYTSRTVKKGDIDSFTFELKELDGLPPNIKAGKNLAGLIEINPGKQTRVSRLLKDKHDIGGGTLLANSTGISKNAAIFERPYTQIKIRQGAQEEIFIVDRDKNPLDAKKVEQGGEDLALNGRYEIYVDRFRFELNLQTTPLNI